MNKNKKAFTLVELIVVITILAILGTIAFISLQGYSKSARDSVRISDIGKIKTSLELFQLNAGKYPETTDYFTILYKGAIARTQGTFGETTYSNVEKLDKIPTDPITDRKYIYSVTNTKQEYEIAGIMEGDEISSHFAQTNAEEKTAILKISGNYNGKLLKVNTGSLDYVLAVPSIITTKLSTLEDIVTNKLLAYNGYKNLPAEYEGSSYDVLGEEGINLVNGNNLIVYSGSLKTLSETTQTGIDARKNLITNLQDAYVGTDIANIGEIAQILNTSMSNTGAVELLASTIVTNDLGGSIAISGGLGSDTLVTPTSTQFLSNCTANGQIYYTDNSGNKLATVTNAGEATWESGKSIIDLTCTGHIIVCNGNNAGYTLQTCNLGSDTVGITSSSYGNRYQFGKSDTSWNVGNSSWNYDWESPGGVDTGSSNYWGVLNDFATTTWLNSDDISRTKMQGPCSTGYHVPTTAEWQVINSAGGWGITNGDLFSNSLKLPKAGRKYRNDGHMGEQDGFGYYWHSSPLDKYGHNVTFTSSTLLNISSGGNARAYGNSVRCFKN